MNIKAMRRTPDRNRERNKPIEESSYLSILKMWIISWSHCQDGVVIGFGHLSNEWKTQQGAVLSAWNTRQETVVGSTRAVFEENTFVNYKTNTKSSGMIPKEMRLKAQWPKNHQMVFSPTGGSWASWKKKKKQTINRKKEIRGYRKELE